MTQKPENDNPKTLWEWALDGTRRTFKPKERRLVLKYLAATSTESYSNYELADRLGVDEATIRADKKKIVQEAAEALSPEQGLELLQEALDEQDYHIRVVKKALKSKDESGNLLIREGSLAHIQYMRLLSDLEARRRATLQESGILRKDLGRLVITDETWEATVADDASVHVNQKKT